MTDAEMQREIEKAERNTRRLRALQAENETERTKVVALVAKTPRHAPAARAEARTNTGLRA